MGRPADQSDRVAAAILHRQQQRDQEIIDGINHVQRKQSQTGRARPTVYAQSGGINFCFDNFGQPLVAPSTLSCHVGFAGRLILADIWSDITCTATVELKWCLNDDYPSMLKAYGLGTIPTLTSALNARLNITTWLKYYQVQDRLVATLTSFSGSATNLTLGLLFRKMPAPGFGTHEVAAGGNVLVTAAGTTITLRH